MDGCSVDMTDVSFASLGLYTCCDRGARGEVGRLCEALDRALHRSEIAGTGIGRALDRSEIAGTGIDRVLERGEIAGTGVHLARGVDGVEAEGL